MAEREGGGPQGIAQEETVTVNLLDDVFIDLYAEPDNTVSNSDVPMVPDAPQLAISIDSSDDDMDPDVQLVSSSIPKSMFADKWTRRSSRYGMSAYCFQNLYLSGAPPILFNCLHFLHNNASTTNLRDVDVGDFFSGKGWFWRLARSNGWHSSFYDKKHDPVFMCICTGWLGWLACLQQCRRLDAGAFSNWGIVCSSWVWLCRAITMRTKERPLGPSDEALVSPTC